MARVKLSPEKRQDLKRLKKAGLYSGDLRKPTRYAAGLTKKFKDFLSGDMRVVTVKSRKAAAELAPDRADRRGRKVLVYAKPSDKISYSRKSNQIKVKTRTETFTIGGSREGKSVYFNSPNGLFRLGTGREIQEKLALYKSKQREFIEAHLVTVEDDEEQDEE